MRRDRKTFAAWSSRRGQASCFLLLALLLPVTCGFCAEPLLVPQTSPSAVLSLRARDAGILDEILIGKGDEVFKGQVLTRLDHYRQSYALEVTRRRLDNRKGIVMAEADLREKEANLEEAKGKYKRRQISDAQMVGAITQWELAKCRLELAQEAMEQVKLDLDLANRALEDRHVKTPIDGKVMDILKTAGERITVGDVVVTVGDFSKLKAEVSLSKEAASKLVAGGILAVKTSPAGRQIEAHIESIAAVPNSTKGEQLIKLVFDNPDKAPGEDPDFPEGPGLPKPAPTARPPGTSDMNRKTGPM
ncbi:MAG: efflux RND transporter periplasmic adaptor subunit [Terrimicrobiaceae bacterium]